MVMLTSELMNALAILADNEELKVTLKQSGKGGLICGAMCMIGGILAGPPGLLVGGALGSVAAFAHGKGTFKPVSDVIRFDLTVAQQERLRDHVEVFIQNLDIQDAITLVAILTRNSSIQTQVLKTLVSFVQNELHHQISSA